MSATWIPYSPSEKTYLFHLCVIHGITGALSAPYGSYQKVIRDMIAEASRHVEGGDLFNDDPWPAREHTSITVPRACKRFLEVKQTEMHNAHDTAIRRGVDTRMTLKFILDGSPY